MRFADDSIQSKSGRKRAAQAIEALALQLVTVPAAWLQKADFSPELRQALTQARALDAHGARKRQIKYLAGLLREDPRQQEQARQLLAGQEQQHQHQAAHFHRLERLRERLCAGEAERAAMLAELTGQVSMSGLAELEQLARGCSGPVDKASYRQLFRLLHQLLAEDSRGQ